MLITRTDREWIEARAVAAGFDLAGIADVPAKDSDDANKQSQRYTEWVEAGRAGEMDYLKRADDSGAMLRGNLHRALPWAQTVIVCALNYNAEAPRSVDASPQGSGWIARYAWSGHGERGSDYHDVMLPKLHAIEQALRDRFGEKFASKSYVDTGPIVERGYAQRAGVGWIGKNTCLLNQREGSWLLLGVIVTSLELEREAWAVQAADRCGSCTRCIDACPTNALTAPRQMDAARCIAYLTIEKKGDIDEDLRRLMGRQVFGCDICQDVCPWNRRAPVAKSDALVPRRELINPALDWLAEMDGTSFNRWFRGSPLERTRRKRIRRNVAIAMGNSGLRRFLPRLEQWMTDGDMVLAEAARWAIGQMENDQRKL
jgi:epoxyqueuosine reductase